MHEAPMARGAAANEFLGHGKHAAPGSDAYVPAGHVDAHAADPAGEYLPDAQALHTAAAVAPTAAEAVPAAHGVHTEMVRGSPLLWITSDISW